MRLVLALLVGLATALVPLLAAARGLPDLELRTRPAHARPGARVGSDGAGASQVFEAETDGLRGIDVAFAPSGEPAELEFVLFALGAAGEPETELRRARGRPGGGGPFAWASFAFEPVPDSAGRTLRFELRAESGAPTPWIRPRRMPGERDARGGVPHEADLFEGEIEAHWDDLSALALDAESVTAGTARLELQPLDRVTGEPAGPFEAVAVRELPTAFEGGSVLLAFEPRPLSRWRRYAWRATLPEGTRLLCWPVPGDDGEPVFPITASQYHGPRRAEARLGPTDGVGWASEESDLVFRTHAGTWAGLKRLPDRLGPARLGGVLLLWLAAVAAILRGARATVSGRTG